MKAIIGKKIGMTRIFDEKGNAVPVTLILAKPNIITQVKPSRVQLGLDENRKINKPLAGHLLKAKTKTRDLKEFSLEGEFKVGDKVDLSQFQVNDKVTVTAISKGKG